MEHKVSFGIVVLLCVLELASCQQSPQTPPAKKDKGTGACEKVTCPCVGGMPGIPGANGIPGIPGHSGGPPGAKGDPGTQGSRGPKGLHGDKGEPGKTGSNGMTGNKGDRGYPGAKGDAGGKGQKGNTGSSGSISAANWKQCVWKNMNNGLDSGKLTDCSFNKLQDNTALKVSFQGNMRVEGDRKCNRWYFKFNRNECSGPMTIEAVVFNDWPSGNPNLLHHRSFEGYCENLARGTVTVELWVGSCIGHTQGDAYTGWKSVSRIMVEEVPRSQ